MSKPKKQHATRRGFLKGAALGAAAFAAPGTGLAAPRPSPRPGARPPSLDQLRADVGPVPPVSPRIDENPGSDFMVDVFKPLGLEYAPENPGSRLPGLHESIISHGGNTMPKLLTCCHEESAVAMAHGFAKIEGHPACRSTDLQAARRLGRLAHRGPVAGDAALGP